MSRVQSLILPKKKKLVQKYIILKTIEIMSFIICWTLGYLREIELFLLKILGHRWTWWRAPLLWRERQEDGKFEVNLGKFSKRLSQKIRSRSIVQVVECLHSKHRALSSSPNTIKKN
jgi:hypothetical protein